jgi:myo-inositol-1(or 4)-monophosphatase
VMKQQEWSRALIPATASVRDATQRISLGEDRTRVLGRGASGDNTLVADKEAEDLLLKAVLGLQQMRALSEEAGWVGDPKAAYTAVIDPLDGSNNYKRGIAFYCTSVAVASGPRMADVKYGVVRDLVSGDVYEAFEGEGATKNGSPISASAVDDPRKAVVGVDVSRGGPELVRSLASLISSVGRQVHFGANALELCMVAEGKVDAFVDLRSLMRVTDFAAAYLIAKEAGAMVTDGSGGPLDLRLEIGERFSFVSSNPTLLPKILGLIPGGVGPH